MPGISNTFTLIHTLVCPCEHMTAHIQPPTNTEAVAESDTQAQPGCVTHRRHTRREETIMSTLFCLLFHRRGDILRGSAGWDEGRWFSDEKQESDWRERKARKKDGDNRGKSLCWGGKSDEVDKSNTAILSMSREETARQRQWLTEGGKGILEREGRGHKVYWWLFGHLCKHNEKIRLGTKASSYLKWGLLSSKCLP